MDDYLSAEGLPEMTVFRRKTIACALAAMVCDLENDGKEDNQEQPEFPAMTEAERWEDRFSEGWGSEEYYLLEEGSISGTAGQTGAQ